jgi:heme-degrading monooxygenase HmoA
MHIILWEYIVTAGQEAAFEKIYGSYGDWAQLFRQSDGYLGTDLVRNSNISPRYITIDRWVSSEAYDAFQEKYHAAYEELDSRCQSLTEHERLIGRGEILPST